MKKLLFISIMSISIFSCTKQAAIEQEKEMLMVQANPVHLSVSIGRSYHTPTATYYWSYILQCDTVLSVPVNVNVEWDINFHPCGIFCSDPPIYTGQGTYTVNYLANNSNLLQKGRTLTSIPIEYPLNYSADSAKIVSATCSDNSIVFEF